MGEQALAAIILAAGQGTRVEAELPARPPEAAATSRR